MPRLGLRAVEKTRDQCRKLHKEVLKQMTKQQNPIEFLHAEAFIGCGLQYLDKLATDMKCKQRVINARAHARWRAAQKRGVETSKKRTSCATPTP